MNKRARKDEGEGSTTDRRTKEKKGDSGMILWGAIACIGLGMAFLLPNIGLAMVALGIAGMLGSYYFDHLLNEEEIRDYFTALSAISQYKLSVVNIDHPYWMEVWGWRNKWKRGAVVLCRMTRKTDPESKEAEAPPAKYGWFLLRKGHPGQIYYQMVQELTKTWVVPIKDVRINEDTVFFEHWDGQWLQYATDTIDVRPIVPILIE